MTHDGRDWNDHSDPDCDGLDLTDVGPEDEDDCPPEDWEAPESERGKWARDYEEQCRLEDEADERQGRLK